MAEAATFSAEMVSISEPEHEEQATLSKQPAVQEPTDQEWHALIDRPLIEWAIDPDRFRDENVEPPTGKAIMRAARMVKQLRCNQIPVLPRLLMNGAGGIVFDWELDGQTLSIEISASGQIEMLIFEDCKVVHRFGWA